MMTSSVGSGRRDPPRLFSPFLYPQPWRIIMRNLHRIAAASGRLRRFCGVMMISLPIVCALFWTFFNTIYTSSFVPTSMIPLPVPVDGELSGLIRLLAFLVEMIPMAVLIFGLHKLRELFCLYQNGHIFSDRNVSCFRCLGRTLIVWVLCDVVNSAAKPCSHHGKITRQTCRLSRSFPCGYYRRLCRSRHPDHCLGYG